MTFGIDFRSVKVGQKLAEEAINGADPAKRCNVSLKGVWYLSDIHTAWRLQRMETGVFVEAEYAATIPKWGTRLLVKRTLSKLVKDTFERMRSNFARE